MYHEYFGLKEPAFSIAVNPKYLYMSRQHKEALAHLIYGVQSGGFVLLSGEVGTGKTTIIRCLLDQLPKKTEIAIVLNPMANVHEMLLTVCEELGVKAWEDGEPSIKNLTDFLYAHLLSNHMRGKNTVLLIDEAQMLSAEVMEQIRLLTNLETNSQKLLQIVLVGQPELNDLLAQTRLRQLSQRITARFHLAPLSERETKFYIEHRLAVAGEKTGKKLFPPKILHRIHSFSGGVPRLINILCERLLIGAYGNNKLEVDDDIFKIAYKEVEGNRKVISTNHTFPKINLYILTGSIAVALLFFVFIYNQISPTTTQITLPNDTATATVEGAIKRELDVYPRTIPALGFNEPSNSGQLNNQPLETPSANTSTYTITSALSPTDYQMGKESIALEQLFNTHEVRTKLEAYPCWETEKHGLSCERIQLKTWDELRSLNRPAVLELITSSKHKAYAVIIGLDKTHAILINSREQRIATPLAEIGEQWTGQTMYLWHKPKSYIKPTAYGTSSPLVGWVAQQFSLIDGQTIPLAHKDFTITLRERIKIFQTQYGLENDGIIGARTIMKLNEALGLAKELEQQNFDVNN